MSGKPGSGGPVPKRTDQRRRRNNEGGQRDVESAPGAPVVDIPDPDPSWHHAAAGWYRSLAESGQSAFYEPSDWWEAYYIAEAISKNLGQQKFSGVLFSSVISAMGELLTSEGSRRRVRLELERGAGDDDEDASVSELDAYRERLNASG